MTLRLHDPAKTIETSGVALRVVAVLVLMLSLVACSTTSAPTETSSVEEQVRNVPIDADAVLLALLAPDNQYSVALVLAELPAAAQQTLRTVPNLHSPGVVDEVALLAYGDVNVEVYRPSGNAPPLISAVELVRPGRELGGLWIGMTASQLRQQLGRQGFASGSTLRFRLIPDAAAPYELSATLNDGLVSELRWAAYLD